uniref:Ribosome protein L17 n=1 Tax=Griffithsia japonica TaxID=83288 RepID=Q7XYA0_GRIJA|nr:ribosome protein L17 [Griffithsia japonica]
MGKSVYSREPTNPAKAVKARGSDLRVSFKNTYETGSAIKGMKLERAQKYLQNVIDKKEIVPFRRYKIGVKGKPQCRTHKVAVGRWPRKSCEFILGLLKNAESNAELRGIDTDALVVTHMQVNKARRGRRRTFRAHGRINAFMSQPCHVEMFLAEPEEPVEGAGNGGARAPAKLTRSHLRSGVRA